MAHHKDRGVLGTKFIMALIAMGICAVGFVATAPYPVLSGAYPVLVGAINGLAALYMGGNAASQYVAAKHGPKEVSAPAPEEPKA